MVDDVHEKLLNTPMISLVMLVISSVQKNHFALFSFVATIHTD